VSGVPATSVAVFGGRVESYVPCGEKKRGKQTGLGEPKGGI